MLEKIVDESSAYYAGLGLNDSADFEEFDFRQLDDNLIWHFLRGYFEANSMLLNDPRTSVYYEPKLDFEVKYMLIKLIFIQF